MLQEDIVTFEAQLAVITDSDDPFKDLQESLDALKAPDPDMIQEGLSSESILHKDLYVTATDLSIMEGDIRQQFQTH